MLSLGHAKIIAGVADQDTQRSLAGKVVSEGLSVRALEALIKQPSASHSPAPAQSIASAHFRDMERSFSQQLGLRVRIHGSTVQGRGKVIIQYSTLDEFDALKERLEINTD